MVRMSAARREVFLISRKNKSVVTIARFDAFDSFSSRRSDSQRVGGSRMYTFEPPILYSETVSAESLSRSAPKLITLFVTLSRPVPLGLFLVAFPPPPVTCPATRLFRPEELPSGVAPFGTIISLGRCPFLSEQLASPCGFA